MKKGTKVSWLAEGATIRGTGVVISDEENGQVLVSVDKGVFEAIPLAYHVVIHCTVTWLTVTAEAKVPEEMPNEDIKPPEFIYLTEGWIYDKPAAPKKLT